MVCFWCPQVRDQVKPQFAFCSEAGVDSGIKSGKRIYKLNQLYLGMTLVVSTLQISEEGQHYNLFYNFTIANPSSESVSSNASPS
jgi:hypothetical protein